MWLVKQRDWYSGVRAIGPEYGRLFRFGLINYMYVCYVCKLRVLSAFSGERGSLLRCVGSVGEAGASHMNKWFNCNQELFLLFPSPLESATHGAQHLLNNTTLKQREPILAPSRNWYIMVISSPVPKLVLVERCEQSWCFWRINPLTRKLRKIIAMCVLFILSTI